MVVLVDDEDLKPLLGQQGGCGQSPDPCAYDHHFISISYQGIVK